MRALAHRRMPRLAVDYVEGGADDEISVGRNVSGLARLSLMPRVLKDVSVRNLGRALFGVEAKLPLAVGPTGMAGMCWRHGDLALARASAAAGVPFVLSTVSNETI